MEQTLHKIVRGLREFYAAYAWLHERRQLLDRPWEAEFLHFGRDGRLHGRLLPPSHGRSRSVTSDGWCPCRPDRSG